MKNQISVFVLFVILVSGCTGQGIWVSTPTPTPQTSSEIVSIDFEESDHNLYRSDSKWNVTYDENSGEVVILGTIEGGSNCQERFLKNATYDEEDKTLHVSVVIVDKQPSPNGCHAAVERFPYRAEIILGNTLLERVHIQHIDRGRLDEETTIPVR